MDHLRLVLSGISITFTVISILLGYTNHDVRNSAANQTSTLSSGVKKLSLAVDNLQDEVDHLRQGLSRTEWRFCISGSFGQWGEWIVGAAVLFIVLLWILPCILSFRQHGKNRDAILREFRQSQSELASQLSRAIDAPPVAPLQRNDIGPEIVQRSQLMDEDGDRDAAADEPPAENESLHGEADAALPQRPDEPADNGSDTIHRPHIAHGSRSIQSLPLDIPPEPRPSIENTNFDVTSFDTSAASGTGG